MSESLYTKIIGDSAPTSATIGVVGQWYLDTTTGKLYECKAVDTTVTPNTYSWSEVGGGTVDQIYDSTSANAQSGVAVASAISSAITTALNTPV